MIISFFTRNYFSRVIVLCCDSCFCTARSIVYLFANLSWYPPYDHPTNSLVMHCLKLGDIHEAALVNLIELNTLRNVDAHKVGSKSMFVQSGAFEQFSTLSGVLSVYEQFSISQNSPAFLPLKRSCTVHNSLSRQSWLGEYCMNVRSRSSSHKIPSPDAWRLVRPANSGSFILSWSLASLPPISLSSA